MTLRRLTIHSASVIVVWSSHSKRTYEVKESFVTARSYTHATGWQIHRGSNDLTYYHNVMVNHALAVSYLGCRPIMSWVNHGCIMSLVNGCVVSWVNRCILYWVNCNIMSWVNGCIMYWVRIKSWVNIMSWVNDMSWVNITSCVYHLWYVCMYVPGFYIALQCVDTPYSAWWMVVSYIWWIAVSCLVGMGVSCLKWIDVECFDWMWHLIIIIIIMV